jgi:hypothetical protein
LLKIKNHGILAFFESKIAILKLSITYDSKFNLSAQFYHIRTHFFRLKTLNIQNATKAQQQKTLNIQNVKAHKNSKQSELASQFVKRT